MAPLNTGKFLQRLFMRAIQGEPLGIVDDIRESMQEAKARKDEHGGDVVETSGEESVQSQKPPVR